MHIYSTRSVYYYMAGVNKGHSLARLRSRQVAPRLLSRQGCATATISASHGRHRLLSRQGCVAAKLSQQSHAAASISAGPRRDYDLLTTSAGLCCGYYLGRLRCGHAAATISAGPRRDYYLRRATRATLRLLSRLGKLRSAATVSAGPRCGYYLRRAALRLLSRQRCAAATKT